MPIDSLPFESAIFLTLLTILASLPTDPYFPFWQKDIPSFQALRKSDTAYENPFYRPPPRSTGYWSERRQDFPVRDIEGRAGGMTLSEDYFGQDGYSSHVYSEENQKAGEKAPKNIREKFGFDSQEVTRNVKWRRPSQARPSKNGSRPCTTNTISTTEKAVNGSKRPQGGEIVFPDVYYKKFVPRLDNCSLHSTFCENLVEYPSEHINQVLRKEGAMLREFFGKDVITDPDIAERINVPEENLCFSRREVVYPKAAQNKDNIWMFIVNNGAYVQGVTVEVCLDPEKSCKMEFPLGYTSYCKQRYIERKLVGLREDGKPHTDSFKLPSCCSCVVKLDARLRLATRDRQGTGQN